MALPAARCKPKMMISRSWLWIGVGSGRRTRQSRKKLIDAQRQSKRSTEKMLANYRNPDDHNSAAGRRFKL
jgi:hypothetical protein